jgi:hypothetical protein
MGRVKRVERSNWNSNPKRSESLRRFAERLRRTRVENAENVASSRSFLGILGKKSPKPSACWRFWRIVDPSILAPARKSYRDAPVLSRGISFNGLDGPDRLLLARSGRSLSWYKAWEYEFHALRGGSFSAIRLLNEQIGKQLRCKVRGRSFTFAGQLLPTPDRLGRLHTMHRGRISGRLQGTVSLKAMRCNACVALSVWWINYVDTGLKSRTRLVPPEQIVVSGGLRRRGQGLSAHFTASLV